MIEAIRIKGGNPLIGNIEILGAKNAALPLLCATLLTDQKLSFDRVPDLADIKTLSALLIQHGCEIKQNGNSFELTTQSIASEVAPYQLVSMMRASILVLGPLLARHGAAKVALPGGCAIGSRPVDFHIRAMEALGAELEVKEGNVIARAPKGGLVGGRINFPKVSVGATENALMAASLARGTTRIENAAREPEIIDLGQLLISMGATISGLGTDTITIEGQSSLNGCQHSVVADRIVAGTFAVGAVITGGDLFLSGARGDHLTSLISLLEEAGANCVSSDDGVQVSMLKGSPKSFDIETREHPGFPTDLQAQVMALACISSGTSTIRETIFENRFMHADELVRLGADIQIHGNQATVRGSKRLSGARVKATDLRAGAALALAGLAASGETLVTALEHLDRGYDNFEEKLRGVGADLERITLNA